MLQSVETLASSRQGLFIGGIWAAPQSGAFLDSFDPTTGRAWFSIADAGSADVDAAVGAARKALHAPAWRDLAASERGRLLLQLADLVAANVETLSRIETKDNGKIIRETHSQIAATSGMYRYYGGMADKIQGDTFPTRNRDMLAYSAREPLGVIAIVIPWNSPLNLLAAILAPCLAVGNTVVIKPSEHASASTLALMELIEAAGFPAGVVNVVTGLGTTAGAALTAHPQIAKIAFVGGAETGKRVASAAAQNLVPTMLELGGKSPHVVFADADMGRAVKGVVGGVFAAGGQTCVAGSRCFVEAKVYDEFSRRLVEAAQGIRVGDPQSADTQMGPLAIEQQLEKVSHYVAEGRSAGAALLHGGERLTGPGWFYPPTIFAEVANEMTIAREEIFGPVASLIRFQDEDHLMEMANATDYGLAAGVWTRDINRALRFARDVDAGRVWINTYRISSPTIPAGGFKRSGYGKHSGFAGIEEFARLKTVTIDFALDQRPG